MPLQLGVAGAGRFRRRTTPGVRNTARVVPAQLWGLPPWTFLRGPRMAWDAACRGGDALTRGVSKLRQARCAASPRLVKYSAGDRDRRRASPGAMHRRPSTRSAPLAAAWTAPGPYATPYAPLCSGATGPQCHAQYFMISKRWRGAGPYAPYGPYAIRPYACAREHARRSRVARDRRSDGDSARRHRLRERAANRLHQFCTPLGALWRTLAGQYEQTVSTRRQSNA